MRHVERGQLKKRNITYVKAFQESSDENKTLENSITARFAGKLVLGTRCFVLEVQRCSQRNDSRQD
jgi:hypothetical protein